MKEIQKTGDVIAEGVFGNAAGGILVIKGDFNRSSIEADPAIQGGLLEIETKKMVCSPRGFWRAVIVTILLLQRLFSFHQDSPLSESPLSIILLPN